MFIETIGVSIYSTICFALYRFQVLYYVSTALHCLKFYLKNKIKFLVFYEIFKIVSVAIFFFL